MSSTGEIIFYTLIGGGLLYLTVGKGGEIIDVGLKHLDSAIKYSGETTIDAVSYFSKALKPGVDSVSNLAKSTEILTKTATGIAQKGQDYVFGILGKDKYVVTDLQLKYGNDTVDCQALFVRKDFTLNEYWLTGLSRIGTTFIILYGVGNVIDYTISNPTSGAGTFMAMALRGGLKASTFVLTLGLQFAYDYVMIKNTLTLDDKDYINNCTQRLVDGVLNKKIKDMKIDLRRSNLAYSNDNDIFTYLGYGGLLYKASYWLTDLLFFVLLNSARNNYINYRVQNNAVGFNIGDVRPLDIISFISGDVNYQGVLRYFIIQNQIAGALNEQNNPLGQQITNALNYVNVYPFGDLWNIRRTQPWLAAGFTLMADLAIGGIFSTPNRTIGITRSMWGMMYNSTQKLMVKTVDGQQIKEEDKNYFGFANFSHLGYYLGVIAITGAIAVPAYSYFSLGRKIRAAFGIIKDLIFVREEIVVNYNGGFNGEVVQQPVAVMVDVPSDSDDEHANPDDPGERPANVDIPQIAKVPSSSSSTDYSFEYESLSDEALDVSSEEITVRYTLDPDIDSLPVISSDPKLDLGGDNIKAVEYPAKIAAIIPKPTPEDILMDKYKNIKMEARSFNYLYRLQKIAADLSNNYSNEESIIKKVDSLAKQFSKRLTRDAIDTIIRGRLLELKLKRDAKKIIKDGIDKSKTKRDILRGVIYPPCVMNMDLPEMTYDYAQCLDVYEDNPDSPNVHINGVIVPPKSDDYVRMSPDDFAEYIIGSTKGFIRYDQITKYQEVFAKFGIPLNLQRMVIHTKQSFRSKAEEFNMYVIDITQGAYIGKSVAFYPIDINNVVNGWINITLPLMWDPLDGFIKKYDGTIADLHLTIETPLTPLIPVNPDIPLTPLIPVTPDIPLTPLIPVNPSIPWSPILDPFIPWSPVHPVAPIIPPNNPPVEEQDLLAKQNGMINGISLNAFQLIANNQGSYVNDNGNGTWNSVPIEINQHNYINKKYYSFQWSPTRCISVEITKNDVKKVPNWYYRILKRCLEEINNLKWDHPMLMSNNYIYIPKDDKLLTDIDQVYFKPLSSLTVQHFYIDSEATFRLRNERQGFTIKTIRFTSFQGNNGRGFTSYDKNNKAIQTALYIAAFENGYGPKTALPYNNRYITSSGNLPALSLGQRIPKWVFLD